MAKGWADKTSRAQWLRQKLPHYPSTANKQTRDAWLAAIAHEYLEQYPWNLRDEFEHPDHQAPFEPVELTKAQKRAAIASREGVGPWLCLEPTSDDKEGQKAKAIKRIEKASVSILCISLIFAHDN
jgi:hypothetical protein